MRFIVGCTCPSNNKKWEQRTNVGCVDVPIPNCIHTKAVNIIYISFFDMQKPVIMDCRSLLLVFCVIVHVTNLWRFTLKARLTSVYAEANAHSADWLMSVFFYELALLHVYSQQGKYIQQCQTILTNTLGASISQHSFFVASHSQKSREAFRQ